MTKVITVVVATAVALGIALVFRSQVPTRADAGNEPIAMQPPVVVPQPAQPVVPDQVKPDTAIRPAATATASPSGSRPPAPQPAAPEEPQGDAASVLKQAAAAYAKVRSIRAEFAQWQENPLLGRRTNSRGTVYQQQPDGFLMKFTQPDGDVIVSDGEYFWVYYPSVDAKQVMRCRSSVAGGLDLQSQFIGDPTKRFSFTDQGADDVAGRAARVLTLTPKEQAGYKSLKVWIDQRDHLVRRFELGMDNGVTQHFDLSNLQVNSTLSNQLFRFSPPAGAKVVDC